MQTRFFFAAFAIAIFSASSAHADITVNGTSYSSGVGLNTANGTFTITGTASGYINVKQNCTIVLDNVTWTASDKKQDLIKITAGLTINLRLKGNSTMGNNSKNYVTGIYVCNGTTLNITNMTEDASLTVSATTDFGTPPLMLWAGPKVKVSAVVGADFALNARGRFAFCPVDMYKRECYNSPRLT